MWEKWAEEIYAKRVAWSLKHAEAPTHLFLPVAVWYELRREEPFRYSGLDGGRRLLFGLHVVLTGDEIKIGILE